MEQLYTYKEVAKMLKVSERSVKRQLDEKNLPVVLVGRLVRIEASVVIKLLTRVESISIEAQNLTL